LKSFKNGEAEIKIRATQERRKVAIDKVVPAVKAILEAMVADLEAKADAHG